MGPDRAQGFQSKKRIKWHGPYAIQDENKGSQVVIPIPDGTGGFKDRAVHNHRVKPYRSRDVKVATPEESLELFQLLDNYEVHQTENGRAAITGLDALRRSCAHEHEADEVIHVGELYCDPGEKWQHVFDGTERVGVISGHAIQDQEVPIPEPEPSPFDAQNTIEQAICDLADRQRLAVARSHVCSQAHNVKHACHVCFEKVSREETEDVMYPMFRGMMSKEEGMCEDSCSECKKEVWIPDQYCKCDGEVLEEIMSNKDAAIKQKEQAQ